MPKDDTKPKTGGEDTEDLKDTVKALSAGLTAIQDSQKAMADGMTMMAKHLEGLPGSISSSLKDVLPAPKDDDDRRQEEPADLEGLSRKDFLGIIMQQVGGVLDDKLGGIDERVEHANENATRSNLVLLLREAQEKHKDFGEWREEIKTQFKENPNLSPEQAYILARGADPTKAQEIDKKFTEADETGEADDKATGTKFGGLRSGSSGGDTEEPTGDLNLQDAAQKAFDEVFEGTDAVVYGGG